MLSVKSTGHVASRRREALEDHRGPGIKFVTKIFIMPFTETEPYCKPFVDKVFLGIDWHLLVRLERGGTYVRPLSEPLVYWLLCATQVCHIAIKKPKKRYERSHFPSYEEDKDTRTESVFLFSG